MKDKRTGANPRKRAVRASKPAPASAAAGGNGHGPTDTELEMFATTLDKIMSVRETRAAWLMGFLVGSALVEQDLG